MRTAYLIYPVWRKFNELEEISNKLLGQYFITISDDPASPAHKGKHSFQQAELYSRISKCTNVTVEHLHRVGMNFARD